MGVQMVDLNGQYKRLKKEIDAAIRKVINESAFINGPQVELFSSNLAEYLNVSHVIPCGNGTDAIRLALRALHVQPGEEIIIPSFAYIAAAEMVTSLGLTPILVDVNPDTFNINPELLEQAISRETKAIIVVHLFGQTCDMEPIMKIAEKYKIGVIEDNAQSLGAEYTFADGRTKKAGTVAHIGTTSFFPSKPLACYGDGGAVMTFDDELASRIRILANHGQVKKYHHKVVGCNSRLDTIQAAILDVKLKYIDEFAATRQKVAGRYDQALSVLGEVCLPQKTSYSTHIYHQYTIRVKDEKRDALRAYLMEKDIPTMIYYPLPVQEQEAYKWVARPSGDLSASVRLCKEVLSLPIHTEMTEGEQAYIIDNIIGFFRKEA